MKELEQKNKYYVPELEEFHVGFECEVYGFNSDKRLNKNLKKEWEKIIYSLEDFKYLKKENLKTNFRVKYLDKEDIESLGWKFDEDETSCLAFVKNIWDLWYYERKQLLTIESEETGVVFKGYIKNKSELKKLLKQLKIIK